MSRRRTPPPADQGPTYIKVGCTGLRSHRRLVFDTVGVWSDSGEVIVGHDKGRTGRGVEANVPESSGLGPVGALLGINQPSSDYMNYRYECPLCGSDYPMRADKDRSIFGPLADAGASFLDLSALRSSI